jgi:hypothetical protein
MGVFRKLKCFGTFGSRVIGLRRLRRLGIPRGADCLSRPTSSPSPVRLYGLIPVSDLEKAGHDMGSKRGDVRREAILDLLERLDHAYKGDCEFSRYRPVV